MRSGEHDLWDAFMATGRARADLSNLRTAFAILADNARRNLAALARAAAGDLQRAADRLGGRR